MDDPGDRLDSWKEIAGYLKRDVTTVQRWEKREDMPVHRHLHDKLGSVYAFRSELDAWSRGRKPRESESEAAPSRGTTRSRAAVALAALGIVFAAVAIARRRPEPAAPRDPIAGARVRYLTDFGGTERAAAVSRDGRFVAFLSDRDGPTDVWVTEVGTGQFRNLTGGAFPELVNPSVRTMGFSPEGDLVTFWTRRAVAFGAAEIGVWAVPTVGGPPRPYLEGVAECDWSRDGRRIVYHTPGTGDPTFIREPGQGVDRPLLTAAAGLHAHFPLWAPDASFIYFVQGTPPAALDIWRLRPGGGAAERVTHHDSRVSHPVMTDRRTLLYLATEADGSGPFLYSMDVEQGAARRVGSAMDRYTSLAASADGRRLVLTVANQKGTLWRMPLGGGDAPAAPAAISLTTASGFAPRLGPGYLLYVSSKGTSDSIWKLEQGRTTELWTAPEARIVGRPEIDAEGRRVAFTAESGGRSVLYSMRADGTDARVVSASLHLRGAPAWAPGGSITSAVDVEGTPRLFAIPPDGAPAPLVPEYSIDPVWSPDGAFVVYSGPDIGTTFPVKAAAMTPGAPPLPNLVLTRGARRVKFLGRRRALVVLRGDIQHKNLWLVDLESRAERQLTALPPDFDVRDFDVSPDGTEVVLERVEERSDVVLLETAAR